MLKFGQIRSGVDGQRGSFERLVRHLAEVNPPAGAAEFRPIEGAGGDGGVEAYWVCTDGTEAGYQAKFHERPGDIDWPKLDSSVRTALENRPALTHLTVAMPCDLTDKRRQRGTSAREKWDKRVQSWKQIAFPRDVAFEFLGVSQIERLLTEQNAVGLREYWFGEKTLSAEWFAEQFARTVTRLEERYHPEDHVDVNASQFFRSLRGSSDWRLGYNPLVKELIEALTDTPEPSSRDAGWYAALTKSIDLLADLARAPIAPGATFPVEHWIQACSTATDALDRALTLLHEKEGTGSQTYERNQRRAMLGELGRVLSTIAERLRSTFQAADLSRYGIIVGEAGSGKSHLMAAEVAAALNAGEPAIMLLGTDFTLGEEPGLQIARRLELGALTTERFLGALEAAAAARGTRALICIDALNEGGGWRFWRERLASFAAQVRANSRLALCISCRDVYAEKVLTAAAREHAAAVEIEGFQSDAELERAATVYMDQRGIARPATPWLPPEFANPLFLRTACVSLERQGMRQFPLGLRGARKMLSFYLDAAANTLDTEYDGTDELAPSLRKAVIEIAGDMAAKRADYVERRTAGRILEAAFESYRCPPGKTWLDLMRLRGLLRADPPECDPSTEADPLEAREDVLRFAFQRIQDQLIAKSLTQDCKGPDNLFEKGGPLAFMIGRWGIEEHWRGVFVALAIEFADEWAAEIVDYMPGKWGNAWSAPSLQEAFVESVRWRQHGSFGPRSLELLNAMDWQTTPIDLLIELSAVEGHPWNGDKLHENLTQRPMPERDAFWTTRINGNVELRGPAHRLTDWGLGTGPATASDETIRLALSTLGWLFTATNMALRDRATKAAAQILIRHPSAIDEFFARFAEVDDVYVLERVLAAVAGGCLRDPNINRLKLAAAATWRHVFGKRVVPAHLLLRDYARLIIELANERGHLPEGCDLARCRPPYGSAAPRFGLDKAKVKDEADAVGDYYIFDSCTGLAGDFGTYTVKQRIREFSSVRRSRPRPLRLSEAFDKFKQRWIVGDELKESLLNILTLTAPRDHRGQDEPSRAESFAHADRELRRLLSGTAILAFAMDVLPFLQGQEGWSGIGDELGQIDDEQARLWIAQRALRLGWNKDLFPHDYSSGSETSRATRIERIGKKYQWIAYHELLAKLSDNYWLAPEWEDGASRAYDTPVDLPFLRDLELTIAPREEGDSVPMSDGLPAVPRLTLAAVPTAEMEPWVFDDKVARERLGLAVCPDIEVTSGEWLTLYRYTSRMTRHAPVEDRSGAPFRLNDFHFVLMAGMKIGQAAEFARRMRSSWSDFHHDWMTWGDLTDGPYLYEAGVRGTWPDTEWVETDGFRSPRATYLRFCREYRWERHLDGTLPTGFSLQVPNPWLLKDLGLHANPHVPGVWADAAGRATIVSNVGGGNSYCLVRRDAMEAVLLDRGVTPLWVGVGERTAWPNPKENAGPRRRWNGVIWTDGDDGKMEAWTEDFIPSLGLWQRRRLNWS